MRPLTKEYKISREELGDMQIPHGSHICIIHIPHRNEDTRTESGVYVVGDQDFKPHLHAERWGYVSAVCPSLIYEPYNADTMLWDTDIEISVGDKVWFDFNKALHAYTFTVDGEWYKLLDYEFLHMAVRGDKVTPLNGYTLFTEYYELPESDLLVTTNIDKRYGVVRYAGTPNRSYAYDEYSDNIYITEGDHVLFEAGTSCFPLESGMHNEFSDTRYVIQQRKRIVAVVDEAHKNIISLHKNVIGVKEIEKSKEVGKIKLLRDQRSYRLGMVERSENDKMPVGTVVVIPKKKGTAFGGLEYLTEDAVMYYETKN